MTRYLPSRTYLHLGVIASAAALVSLWIAIRWAPASVAVVLLITTAAVNFYLARRPEIEITPETITVGDREFLWSEIARFERTGWISPLVVWMVLKDGRRFLVIYPGALSGSRKLSDELTRRLNRSRENVPIKSRDAAPVPAGVKAAAKLKKRPPMLNAADEAEVERLFQRLKTVGHLESSDEK
jgi:hypothetical protein